MTEVFRPDFQTTSDDAPLESGLYIRDIATACLDCIAKGEKGKRCTPNQAKARHELLGKTLHAMQFTDGVLRCSEGENDSPCEQTCQRFHREVWQCANFPHNCQPDSLDTRQQGIVRDVIRAQRENVVCETLAIQAQETCHRNGGIAGKKTASGVATVDKTISNEKTLLSAQESLNKCGKCPHKEACNSLINTLRSKAETIALAADNDW